MSASTPTPQPALSVPLVAQAGAHPVPALNVPGADAQAVPASPAAPADAQASVAVVPAQASSHVTAMPWRDWRSATPARIALGRAGVSIPTDEALRFGLAHASARDAIHTPLDTAALQADLEQLGHAVLLARSCAADRTSYLRRPDLGRQLQPTDSDTLRALAASRPQAPDIALVIGDGLSSLAVQRHAAALADIESQQRSLAEQVMTDHALLVTSQSRRLALQSSAELADQVLASWDRQYLSGRKTWQDLMNSAREQVQVQVQLADLEGSQLVASWRLALTVGELRTGELQAPAEQK